MTLSRPLVRCLPLLVAVLGCAGSLSAATLTFDAAVTSNAQTGTWDYNTTANWNNGTGDVKWTSNATTGADTAVFGVSGATSGAVTVSTTNGAVYVGGMTFNQSGYTISGNVLTLSPSAANGTVIVDTTTTTGNTTISSVITGSSSLTKNGTGTLTLNASNTFTGGIFLSAGTLAIPTQGASLGSSASPAVQLTFTGNSTFQIGNNNLVANRQLAINSNYTGTIDTGSNTNSGVQGVISGNGNLIKIGAGTLTLAGSNTYMGTTAANGGTLIINSASTGTGALSVNNTGTLLGGTGTINAAVIVNSGASITGGTTGGTSTTTQTAGTLTLAGGLTLAGTSGSLANYQVDVAGAMADKLAITGNLDLSTAFDKLTVNVVSAATQSSYPIATFTGSLSGTFDTLSLPSGYSLTYGAHEIDLIVAVPEPATWLAGAMLFAAAIWTGRKRLGAVARPA